jgi:hypothetical protein
MRLLMRPNSGMENRNEAGMAYVALLALLAIMSTLGMAFLFKVGIETSVIETRGNGMQAHYLAEAAANHALWRLLNEPGFTVASDKYYMHSLGAGRYGYKVRKPTPTTFGTVATVGAMGDITTRQSYVQYIPSNVYTAYGDSTSTLPQGRRLVGASWGDPDDIPVGNTNTIQWVELEGCPIRTELVGGVIDGDDDIKLAVWDGISWGNSHTFSTDVDKNHKCFDIAYESQSGDALVVGRLGSGTALGYNIWDGSAWAFATPQNAFNLPDGEVHAVVMASQPGGDEILIAVVSSLDEVHLVQWNGSSFNDLVTIETTNAGKGIKMVEVIYEHQSGDAMVVWTRDNDRALKYRMWNGVTLGIIGDLPDFNGEENYVILGTADSDPTSDYIFIGATDNHKDLHAAVWDGDAWIDSRRIETDLDDNLTQVFDVAWEASGEEAVIAWAPKNETYVRFLAWQKGTELADVAVQKGPGMQDQPWLVRLLPISGTEKIVLLGENISNDLRYSLWTGDRFKGDPAILLESDVPVLNEVAYDCAEANVPRTGGTGTGGG